MTHPLDWGRLANALADDPADRKMLIDALTRSEQAVTGEPQDLVNAQEAYQLVGYWYAVAKDRKRRAKLGANTKEEKLLVADFQFYEDLLEAAVKGLNAAVIVIQHLNKQERY